MNDDQTACSNCTCPLNYECLRFQYFFESNYILIEEFQHNGDYSCDHKQESQTQPDTTISQEHLF